MYGHVKVLAKEIITGLEKFEGGKTINDILYKNRHKP